MADSLEQTILPPDYHRSIFEVEQRHWWHRGMQSIAATFLSERLSRREQSLLDIGCGTGGYLAWATTTGSFSRLAGIEVSAEALELAHERAPSAELALAGAARIPFDDASFDLVTLNDVLQHIHETEIGASLAEIRRVLRPGGALLIRTNGARRRRRAAADWRVYDLESLRAELEHAGFAVRRISYVNVVLSVWGQLRGRAPHLPDEGSHGIPRPASTIATAVGSRLLGLEARLLRRPGRCLPFGHTLIALATPAVVPQPGAGAFFDEESTRYDRVYDAQSTGGRILRARLATVLQLVGDGPGEVLDAGMGGGRLLEELERNEWTVSGIDISERMVELARQRIPDRRESLRQGDLESLQFDAESFDVAVATGALEYSTDIRRALLELVRVVRPGGRIVVSFPDYAAPYSVALMRLWYPSVRLVKRIAPFGRPAPHLRRQLLSPGGLQRLVETTGLVIESVVPLGPRPVPLTLGRRLDGTGSRAERWLATQLVLSARRPRSPS